MNSTAARIRAEIVDRARHVARGPHHTGVVDGLTLALSLVMAESGDEAVRAVIALDEIRVAMLLYKLNVDPNGSWDVDLLWRDVPPRVRDLYRIRARYFINELARMTRDEINQQVREGEQG